MMRTLAFCVLGGPFVGALVCWYFFPETIYLTIPVLTAIYCDEFLREPSGRLAVFLFSLALIVTGLLSGFYLLLAIGTVVVSLLAVTWLYPMMVLRLPIWLQRPIYRGWKKKLLNSKVNPLLDYPFMIFVELELDSHFEKGGLKAAQQAASDKIKNIADSFTTALTNKGLKNVC